MCLKDALAPPLYPLKPRKSQKAALRQRPALEALHKENTGGLDYLRKQEKRGRDRERKPRRKASCKKVDIAKLCVMLTSFLLAPKVCLLYQTRVQTITAVSQPTMSSKCLHFQMLGTDAFPYLVSCMQALGLFLKPKPGWDGRRMDQATILYRRKYKDRALHDPLIVAW